MLSSTSNNNKIIIIIINKKKKAASPLSRNSLKEAHVSDILNHPVV